MSVKIKETIERDCCMGKDMKPYQGEGREKLRKPVFCQYCGQIWENEKETGSGSIDAVCVKVFIK